jgi:hypothetical protein
VLLIPLAQAASGELPVALELIYVVRGGGAWSGGPVLFEGPRFDLPLKRVSWRFFLPEGFDYAGFGGTMTVDAEQAARPVFHRYDLAAYEEAVRREQAADNEKARAFQDAGNRLAQEGRQREAKQALELSWNYSGNDAALNEDARVQLHKLAKEQALVCLVGRRGLLRQQEAGAAEAPAPPGGGPPDAGDQFNRADAERLQNSLNRQDSENLELITGRLIEMQETAAGTEAQIDVAVPLRGRVLDFTRPLQVNPGAEMAVAFTASPADAGERPRGGWMWAAGVFALAWAGIQAWPRMAGK